MQDRIQGKKSLLQLSALLQQRNTRSVLFVTGCHLSKAPIFLELVSKLQLPYQVIHAPGGVLQLDAIPEFAKLDAVVAIGGGKTIDYAKGILHRYNHPAFFAAAPTTAGSGSEATPIAVFYSGTEKVSLDAPALLPQLAILDESLIVDAPALQKAISGADALAQSIESIWNVHSTEESEIFSLKGLELAWLKLATFVHSRREEAAKEMQWAAHLAGRAISLTRTTGPHALSYYLTANFGVQHGQAVALTLPLFFLYNQNDENIRQLQKICDIIGARSPEDALTDCRELFRSIGLATTLAELNLSSINLDHWLASVNQQRFGNNPTPFDTAILKALFLRYLC
jgi:alcohol dehydrogenase class IV